ncbi:MAG: hypothetical protein AAF543_07320 [Pseudomonadota bacterium]
MLRTRSHADLYELIVWGALIAPGVILNKDGSLQASFRFRGPDLASAIEAELGRLQRQWFAKRKSLGRLLIEMISKEESGLINTDALNKSADANDALAELADDAVGFGHFTPVIIVWDEDPDLASEKLALVRREVEGLGFTAKAETFNALEAWLSTLPGYNWRNVRRPLVSSLNLAHMLPLSAVWFGERRNLHFDAPALLVAETQGATPFHLNLHTGDDLLPGNWTVVCEKILV